MSKTALSTEEVRREQWDSVLATITRDYRGAHARLQVFGSDAGAQVQVEDRPFDGMAVDLKDGEQTVWIHFESSPGNHMAHGVHNVSAIRMLLPTATSGPVIEVQGADGTTTLLTLNIPEENALPPTGAE
jgi:hypothetical protein